MKTEELAKQIYEHITKLSRGGYHWDQWDDKREIENITKLINEHINNDTNIINK